jgi:hypothetical protein
MSSSLSSFPQVPSPPLSHTHEITNTYVQKQTIKKKVREWSAHVAGKELWYTHFTRFTGAKVQILTQKALLGRANSARANPLSQSPCPLRLSVCACVYVCNARQHTSAHVSITSREFTSHQSNVSISVSPPERDTPPSLLFLCC